MTPRRYLSRRARIAGFTMMELMIAVSLLSIVGAMLYGGISRSIDAKEQIEKISDRYDEIRIALHRMADEISMAYLSDHYNREERRSKTIFREDDEGTSERLIFSSFGHVRRVRDAYESDQNVLAYWVDTDPEDGSTTALLRREYPRIDERTGEDDLDDRRGYTDVLCPRVKRLEFDYWDAAEKEWDEEWNTESVENGHKLPPRVRIRMTVETEQGRVQVFETQAEIQLHLPVKLST